MCADIFVCSQEKNVYDECVCRFIALSYQLHFGKERVCFVVIIPVFNKVFDNFFFVKAPRSILCVYACMCCVCLVCFYRFFLLYIHLVVPRYITDPNGLIVKIQTASESFHISALRHFVLQITKGLYSLS